MELNSATDIFTKIKNKDFADLVLEISKICPIDTEKLINEWNTGNKCLLDLQMERSEKLKESGPDYSVYDRDIYLNEAFYCWKTYSRRYLLLLRKWLLTENCPINVQEINSILDLGCGLAFTTIGLSSIFTNAKIYGTNTENSIQFIFDKHITEKFPNIEIVPDRFNLTLDRKFDIIFASEFFEHLVKPLDFLENLLFAYSPKYIIFANTFTKMAIGHFYEYKYNGEFYIGDSISRKFGRILRDHGYIKLETGFFNGRPAIFMKSESTQKHRGLF